MSGTEVVFDRGSLRVEYTAERSVWQYTERPVHQWSFTVDIEQADSETDELFRVGRGGALMVELYGRNAFDALDEHSQAAMEVGEQVFDPVSGELSADLLDKIEALGDRVLILSEIEVEPRWRGLGLGPVIAGTVIEGLIGGVSVVVCKPAPLHRPVGSDGEYRDYRDGEWERAVEKLSRLWSSLGFKHHAGGVHYLDPAKVDFGRRYRAIMNEYLSVQDDLIPAPVMAARPRIYAVDDGDDET